jgi:hypothetical protein
VRSCTGLKRVRARITGIFFVVTFISIAALPLSAGAGVGLLAVDTIGNDPTCWPIRIESLIGRCSGKCRYGGYVPECNRIKNSAAGDPSCRP